MMKKRYLHRHRAQSPDLFDQLEQPADQHALVEAEHLILDIADYVYAHTSLKPISKTLFLISRCLCVAKLGGGASTATELCGKYDQMRASLNGAALGDDFDFPTVVAECEHHVPRVLDAINKVCRLTDKTDSLGLVFNTLLRGKFQGGEGMGTFLTPEEVVFPMVDMLLKVVDNDALDRLGGSQLLYGDICGGTGRFVYALARRLEARGIPRRQLEKAARLFDQSLMAVDLGRLNFLFEGMQPAFERVGDSLIAPQVTALKSRFVLLATNPPFGSNKYRWNRELAEALPYEVLATIGVRGNGDTADPSELFFFRNLDLLAPGGTLAVVLPDGVVQSEGFRKALAVYERVRKTHLDVAAIVSLPSVTFALGGTVAKTSFLVVQKQDEPKDKPLYVAVSHHVGFVKRGKKRADDPGGNELLKIADEFGSRRPAFGRLVGCWRAHDSFVAARLMHALENGSSSGKETPLADLVEMARDFQKGGGFKNDERFHVSVLDVDATGLIDIVAASRNKPMSKGLTCGPGDILVSCMNPRIWRVTVLPNIQGLWSCSAEFIVLRVKKTEDRWKIALGLHHPRVMQAVQTMAKGTSSSRQRVPKDKVLSVSIPEIKVPKNFAEYMEWREEFYRKRLREADAYHEIHEGRSEFSW
jgi:type I restriction-modification system DNA methylase subunit